MIQKLHTAFWFAQRPSHWSHGIALARRKFLRNYDTPELRAQARAWAAERAVPEAEALATVGITGTITGLPETLRQEGLDLASRSAVAMGGPGDVNLLYDAVRLSQAKRIIETGVAYGWSSLAILAALADQPDAQLVSVDMPYPKMGNESFVGIAVPERLRQPWTLIREPDRRGIEKAIHACQGSIDLCHYDSDKSWWGRHYAFPKLWAALRVGGVFISDDIQDNLYFAEFVAAQEMPYAVTEFDGKFVGIMVKQAP